MEKEIWLPVVGYEGYYEVSCFARVRSIKKRKGARIGIRAQHVHPSGYYCLNLSMNGSNKTHRVHRLVAMAFLSNPDNLPEINHIDANTLNNVPSNLEWCTRQENSDHAMKMGLYPAGTRSYKSKLTEDQVKSIRKEYLQEATSISTISCKYKVAIHSIFRILKGTTYRQICQLDSLQERINLKMTSLFPSINEEKRVLVLSLWENGFHQAEIKRRTGLCKSTIRKITLSNQINK